MLVKELHSMIERKQPTGSLGAKWALPISRFKNRGHSLQIHKNSVSFNLYHTDKLPYRGFYSKIKWCLQNQISY